MEVISSNIVKARKEHKCNWCCHVIPRGERYNKATCKYDDIYTWKSHLKCMELVSVLNMEGDEGVSDDNFCESIKVEFAKIWQETNPDLYESEGFQIPSFKDQLDFVYEKRCINE